MKCPHCKAQFLTIMHTDNCIICRKPLFVDVLLTNNYTPLEERSAKMVILKGRTAEDDPHEFRFDPQAEWPEYLGLGDLIYSPRN